MTPDTNQTVLTDAERIEVRNAALEEAAVAVDKLAELSTRVYEERKDSHSEGRMDGLDAALATVRALKSTPAPMSTTSMSPTSGDVELSPLPFSPYLIRDQQAPQEWRMWTAYNEDQMQAYARAAVLADRQQSKGEQ